MLYLFVGQTNPDPVPPTPQTPIMVCKQLLLSLQPRIQTRNSNKPALNDILQTLYILHVCINKYIISA